MQIPTSSCLLVVTVTCLAGRARLEQDIELISRAPEGLPANDSSDDCCASADGTVVAFSSAASNLVPDDVNGFADIFAWEEGKGIERISVGAGSVGGNQVSRWPSVSDDGRWVCFASDASNLVPGDDNDERDVFLYDRERNSLRVVSANGLVWGNGESGWPQLAGNGSCVVFQSEATNLTTASQEADIDIFVFDIGEGTIHLVSKGIGGAHTNDHSWWPSVSQSGRTVVFTSGASNLVENDDNGFSDVFAYDRELDEMQLISRTKLGVQANGDSDMAHVSGDGRLVVFSSEADNLVSDDENSVWDVFLCDLKTQEIRRLSVGRGDVEVGADSVDPRISPRGDLVVFASVGKRVVARGYPPARVFLYRVGVGQAVRISGESSRSAGTWSGSAEIASSGEYVVFASDNPDLVEGDTNGTVDVFRVRVSGEGR